jgi:aryl-alcohol dehydrogenase-like predicted oxidoreductase
VQSMTIDQYRSGVSLGLGLLQLGRPWGARPRPDLPDANEIADLLGTALELGITFFDTAPAYGASEQNFGAAIKSMGVGERITVATKFGEYWNATDQSSNVNHSLMTSTKSLTRSIYHLGLVSLLQVHKCSVTTVQDPEVRAFCELVRAFGIPVGASVGDPATLDAVLASGLFDAVQFPLNEGYPKFGELSSQIESAGLLCIVNRPFGMGKVGLTDSERCHAFEFIAKRISCGVILTGTSNAEHLRQNVKSFRSVFGDPQLTY